MSNKLLKNIPKMTQMYMQTPWLKIVQSRQMLSLQA